MKGVRTWHLVAHGTLYQPWTGRKTIVKKLGSHSAAGLLMNDTDPDNNPLTAIKVANPAHGTLTVNPNGSFTYTPFANYSGVDTFTYKANDGAVDSVTVTATINIMPSAMDSWAPVPSPRDPRQVVWHDPWAGPYLSPAGQSAVNQINSWYTAGTSGGLTQDTFRSYDDNHSQLHAPDQVYPQLTIAPAMIGYNNTGPDVFGPRVTFGVMSYRSNSTHMDHDPAAMVEGNIRDNVYNWYDSGGSAPYDETWYETLYRNNFLLIQPAVQTFTDPVTPGQFQDKYTFLTPYYLQSVGASGTDSEWMKPIIFAAGSLPPDLKTRALRQGVYIPMLMYLFKKNLTGNIRDAAANQAAYKLPDEARSTTVDLANAPFLNGMINSAHALTHIPPVARLSVDSVTVTDGSGYSRPAYWDSSSSSFTGALRQGETMEIILNMSPSWSDAGYNISSYYAARLRGATNGTVTTLSPGRFKITVPWTNTGRMYDNRTDFLLLATDNAGYDSAPAYVSIKHIQSGETWMYGVGSYPQAPGGMSITADSADPLPTDASGSTATSTALPAPTTFSTVPIKAAKTKHDHPLHDLLGSRDDILGAKRKPW